MQQKNPKAVFENFQENAETAKDAEIASNPFDMKGVMDVQRKNFQAMVEVNQKAFQGWQSMLRRQTEMTAKFFQDNADFARKMAGGEVPASPSSVNAMLETIMANSRELANIACSCTTETADILSRRTSESMDIIKPAKLKTK